MEALSALSAKLVRSQHNDRVLRTVVAALLLQQEVGYVVPIGEMIRHTPSPRGSQDIEGQHNQLLLGGHSCNMSRSFFESGQD